MRFFVTLLCILIFSTSIVLAETIKVTSFEPISSREPFETYQIKTMEKCKFKNGVVFDEGAVITGKTINVKSSRRGKRDAYIEFKPTQYESNGQTLNLHNEKIKAKIVRHNPLDMGEATTFIALNVVECFLPGVFEVHSFMKGYQGADEGTKMKSGFVQMYKDSPLSFIEKGNEINTEPGDILLLKIKFRS